jgi:hypothetical protein
MQFIFSKEEYVYVSVFKSFRTSRLARELQMVQLSASRCSYIAILLVSLVNFSAITLVLLLNESSLLISLSTSPETFEYTLVYVFCLRVLCWQHDCRR